MRVLGITRRQLQYWARTDLIRPANRTRGGHPRYSFEDLLALRAAKRLLDAGVSLQRLRKSIRALRSVLPGVRRPLADLVLVASADAVLVVREGTAFEAVSGQAWVFEVARLVREVETRTRLLRSRPASRPVRVPPPAGTAEGSP